MIFQHLGVSRINMSSAIFQFSIMYHTIRFEYVESSVMNTKICPQITDPRASQLLPILVIQASKKFELL